MSNFLTVVQVTGGLNGTAPRIHCASTNDDLAAITAVGYVADQVAKGTMSYFDLIRINYDVDGTEGTGWFRITNTSSGSLVADVGSGTPAAGRTALGIKSGTTAIYDGVATSNAYAVPGMVATDKVVATILTSTTAAAAVAKAVPGTDILTVTFTVAPGAGTSVTYIATAV